MQKGQEESGSPTALLVVQNGPAQYSVDLQQKQFRNVRTPHKSLDFDSEKGRKMCEQTGIIVCRECTMAAIISPAIDRTELRCMNCLALIVPWVRL